MDAAAGGQCMTTPTNGPKNAPQPITPPSRTTRAVVQSLQVLALYAALVTVVCLLVTTCSPATAGTIAPHSAAGYAGPARESDGQTLAGLDTTGAQPAFIAAFLCVPFAYARAMAGLGGDTARCAGYLQYRSANPSKSCHPIALAASGRTLFKTEGAAHHG